MTIPQYPLQSALVDRDGNAGAVAGKAVGGEVVHGAALADPADDLVCLGNEVVRDERPDAAADRLLGGPAGQPARAPGSTW